MAPMIKEKIERTISNSSIVIPFCCVFSLDINYGVRIISCSFHDVETGTSISKVLYPDFETVTWYVPESRLENTTWPGGVHDVVRVTATSDMMGVEVGVIVEKNTLFLINCFLYRWCFPSK